MSSAVADSQFESETRHVLQGAVILLGAKYRMPHLSDLWDGHEVELRYDPADTRSVHVSSIDGQYIGEAHRIEALHAQPGSRVVRMHTTRWTANESIGNGLAIAQRALRLLTDVGALVVGIEIGSDRATVQLAKSPVGIEGIELKPEIVTVRDEVIGRARFAGITLEWRHEK